ncbi:hypothetical protein CFOL_v3_07407 [Cephalotus follicularis]|uniref:Mal d 1-associated protein n=1 Tax=Cephalotus follicularis TaxID=3775 RepID=A0A1Q3B7I2_CEPFO|nr:hypothetical protein CFOL_v3_07407 [Cephalotus follicularis]
MGWVWRDEEVVKSGGSGDGGEIRSDGGGERCSTRKVVRTHCKTEEVEPGVFLRKCQKSSELLRDCLGKATEVLESSTEYTEDDVTEQVVKGGSKFDDGPFDFPGIRSDIEAMEGRLFGGMQRFFDAAEEMKNSIFDTFGPPHLYDGKSSSPPSKRREIPIERHPPPPKPKELNSGHFDLSGLAKDV